MSLTIFFTTALLPRKDSEKTSMSCIADSGREQENKKSEYAVNCNALATCLILCSSKFEVQLFDPLVSDNY